MTPDASAPCPPEETLALVAAGTDVDPAVQAHVRSCPACAGAIAEMHEDARFLAEAAPMLRSGARARRGEITVGDSIPGFTILGEIHRGGQGVVYKAWHEPTHRFLAIKLLLQGAFATPRQRFRFDREIDIAAQLRHPNIVTLYETGALPGGRVGYAMEYVDGVPLDQWAAGVRSSDRSPRERLAVLLHVLRRICDAIRYAHERGIVHRDLKPGNILVDREGEPRVLDFGLAKALGDLAAARGMPSAPTESGEICGTCAYAAPEQFTGQPDLIDLRTDVYALGVLGFELLTGRLPYPLDGSMSEILRTIQERPPDRPSRLVPGIDTDLETILLKALAKEPARRYVNAGALLEDLERHRRGDLVAARRESTLYVIVRTARRFRLAIGAVLAALILLLGTSILLAVQAGRIATERDRARAALRESNLQRAIAMATSGNVASAMQLLMDEAIQSVPPDAPATPWDAGAWPGAPEHHWALMQIASRELCLHTFRPADGTRLTVAAMSPDGMHAVFGSPDGGLYLWHLDPPRPRASSTIPGGELRALAFSPDGARIAAGDQSGRVHVFAIAADSTLVALPAMKEAGPQDGAVTWLAWGHAPSHVAAVHASGVVRLLDTSSGSAVRTWGIPVTSDAYTALSPDGMHVAVVRRMDPAVLVFRLDSPDPASAPVAPAWIQSLAEAPLGVSFIDSTTLALTRSDRTVGLVRASDGTPIASHADLEGGQPRLSPDGRWLAVAQIQDRSVLIQSRDDARLGHRRFGHAMSVRVVGFTSRSEHLLTLDHAGVARLFIVDPRTGRELLRGHERTVYGVAVHPDGRTVATASHDRTARLWDLASGTLLETLAGHADAVLSIAMSQDGRMLATGGHQGDRSIRIWDLSVRPAECLHILHGHAHHVHFLAFSPDGRRLASAGGHADGTVRVWNTSTGEGSIVWTGAAGIAAYCVHFSPDGRTLAWSDATGGLYLQRGVSAPAVIRPALDVALREFAFSPDGRRIATVADDAVVRIWSAERLVEEQTLIGHVGPIHAVAWSPDGNLLATGGRSARILLWDPATGRRLMELESPGESTYGLAFSPDGRFLMCASTAPEVAVLDLHTGIPLIANALEFHLTQPRDPPIDPRREARVRAWIRAHRAE